MAAEEMIMLSGGFDPLHIGHIEMIVHANLYGKVVIALNSDDWLMRKKGKKFMNWNERAGILRLLRPVDGVVSVSDSDGTVCDAIRKYRPRYFGNGGDRKEDNTPELAACKEYGCRPLFNLGGSKVQSSSTLLSQYREEPVDREWGHYSVLHEDSNFKVKLLTVQPGKATSMQRHTKRRETWITADGQARHHNPMEWHRLENTSLNTPMSVVEVQTGLYFGEDDIERATLTAEGTHTCTSCGHVTDHMRYYPLCLKCGYEAQRRHG